MSQQSLVLQGSLAEVSVDEVLSTISLSRSCLRVEFDDEEAATIVVKAGNVLRAEGGSAGSGRSAFQALRRRDAGGFRVYRQPFDGQEGQPIGTLTELLGAPPEAAEAYVPILAGATGDEGLSDVLDIMSLSRQRLELRIYRADGSVGFLLCKAGLVVRAHIEPEGLEGRSALLAMNRVPSVRFELARAPRDAALPRPFGSLTELKVTAAKRGDPARITRAAHRSVIRGPFDEHSFLDILQIVTASRQLLEITLTRRGDWRGVVLVKAGQLLDARTEGGDVGVAALYSLMADPGDAFDAVLSQRAKPPSTSLGDLRQLTSAAAQGVQERLPTEPASLDIEPEVDEPVPRAEIADEEVTAIGPMPTPPVSPMAAEITHLARGIGRIEQQLSRQDQILERALGRGDPQPKPTSPSRGLLLGVLGAQVLVAALLVGLIAALVLT